MHTNVSTYIIFLLLILYILFYIYSVPAMIVQPESEWFHVKKQIKNK